jgi:hypothetical protein
MKLRTGARTYREEKHEGLDLFVSLIKGSGPEWIGYIQIILFIRFYNTDTWASRS